MISVMILLFQRNETKEKYNEWLILSEKQLILFKNFQLLYSVLH